jgi:hypothetical protein
MADDPDEGLLAHNMIDVHGTGAAAIARENARGAAVAGQPVPARSWIRVLGIIQRQRAAQPAAGRVNPRTFDRFAG